MIQGELIRFMEASMWLRHQLPVVLATLASVGFAACSSSSSSGLGRDAGHWWSTERNRCSGRGRNAAHWWSTGRNRCSERGRDAGHWWNGWFRGRDGFWRSNDNEFGRLDGYRGVQWQFGRFVERGRLVRDRHGNLRHGYMRRKHFVHFQKQLPLSRWVYVGDMRRHALLE